jgi:hypothetical protein
MFKRYGRDRAAPEYQVTGKTWRAWRESMCLYNGWILATHASSRL